MRQGTIDDDDESECLPRSLIPSPMPCHSKLNLGPINPKKWEILSQRYLTDKKSSSDGKENTIKSTHPLAAPCLNSTQMQQQKLERLVLQEERRRQADTEFLSHPPLTVDTGDAAIGHENDADDLDESLISVTAPTPKKTRQVGKQLAPEWKASLDCWVPIPDPVESLEPDVRRLRGVYWPNKTFSNTDEDGVAVQPLKWYF